MPPQVIQDIDLDQMSNLPVTKISSTRVPYYSVKKIVPNSNIIHPSYSNGWEKKKWYIYAGLFWLTTLYIILLYSLRDSGTYLVVKQNFCPKGTFTGTVECSRPDLFAFQVSAGMAVIYCGIMGVVSWYITRQVHTKIPATPEGRLYGYLPDNESIAAAQIVFQAWDFVISLFIAEHCTVIFLCHHLCAALLSWFSLRHQFLHYYGIFFLGLSEFSSMFLLFVDLANYFPPDQGTPTSFVLENFVMPGFAISFTLYRVILWWKVSLQLWKDAIHVLSTGKSEQYRPRKNYVLYIYLVSNIALGILQLYWFGLIVNEAKKSLA